MLQFNNLRIAYKSQIQHQQKDSWFNKTLDYKWS